MNVVDAVSGRAWHSAFQTEYFGRNYTAGGFFALAWDGVTTAGRNKSFVCQYVVKLSVLKALGDSSNEAHWERWDSPVITIAR